MQQFWGLAAAALIGTAAVADESAVRGVIDDQIAALRADDFDTAFTFASPSIRGLFGTSANFGRMVREGYPMVWRPAEVEYLTSDPVGSGWRQEVLITDAEGRLHVLRYSMIETEAGWRINGVQILGEAQIGA